MKVISREYVLENIEFFVNEINKGKIFVYPTDTIYGIGCDTTNSGSVSKIYETKKREEKPLSICAPSKDWILENFDFGTNEKEIEKLPGPYTLILKLKNKNSVSKEVNKRLDQSIGVRLIDNWFFEIISKSQKPFVSTSLNISGEPNIISIDKIPKEIYEKLDYIIDDGEKLGNPSTIVDLRENEVKIIKR